MGGALWSRLSSTRAGLNNQPSIAGGESSWTETTCPTYRQARDEVEASAKASSHSLVAAKPASCWFGSFECTGVLVGSVARDTDAHRAGLQVNDILKAVDGAEVQTRLDFDAKLACVDGGRRARITVRRAGRLEHFWIARTHR
jgi:C-terminal processing protease CtpA/Prc